MSAMPVNEVVSNNTTNATSPPVSTAQQAAANAANSDAQQQANLLNVQVNNENDALNVMAGFLQVAQRRGAYSLAEAAKIMDCIKFFGKPQQAVNPSTTQ